MFLLDFAEELERGKRRSGVRPIVEGTALKHSAELPPVVPAVSGDTASWLNLWVRFSEVIMQKVKISQVC